jgi:hypothetical protein
MENQSFVHPAGLEAYQTSDFYLACYLRCLGYTLDGVRRDGRRVVFCFNDRPHRQDDLIAFFGNKAEVNSPWLKSAPLLKSFDAENVSS